VDSGEELPDGMTVNDIEEILGERGCKLHHLTKFKRKNGPGSLRHQQYLVRGSFLEGNDGDSDEEEDNCPESNTFWVDEDRLVEDVGKDCVRDALVARHERVIEGLDDVDE
jgi:hypothetical protein